MKGVILGQCQGHMILGSMDVGRCWGREKERRHTSHDSTSSRENGSEARDMVTRGKRAPKLRGNEGTKPTEIDASIELCTVTLQRHEIYSGRLIKVNLLN